MTRSKYPSQLEFRESDFPKAARTGPGSGKLGGRRRGPGDPEFSASFFSGEKAQ